jgi:DnaJ-class molecular chaperone
LLEDNHCPNCHGTGKPVVVEYEEIKGVPEGYKAVINCGLWYIVPMNVYESYLSNGKKLPYKIGSIDECMCEDCHGSGEKFDRFSPDVVNRLLNTVYKRCPSCKGKSKINRKILAITVVQIDGKHSFEIKRVMT